VPSVGGVLNSDLPIRWAVRSTEDHHLDVIPALAREVLCSDSGQVLRREIEPVQNWYDEVVITCTFQSEAAASVALSASDFFIVAIECGTSVLTDLAELMQRVWRLSAEVEATTNFLGFVLLRDERVTDVDPAALVCARYPGKVLALTDSETLEIDYGALTSEIYRRVTWLELIG
jgi:cellulose biosynthesis protein BcsQ